MSASWVDIVIVAVLLYAIYDGLERGFASLIATLGSFLASLWLAVRYHGLVGNFFVEKFGIASGWTDVLGYIVVALVSQVVIEELLLLGMSKLPKKLHTSQMNHWLGSVLSLANAIIVISFFLLLVLALPLRGTIKQDIRQSVIGRAFVAASERYGGAVRSSLSEFAKDAVKFLTVEPGSKERIPLDIPKSQVSFAVDAASETALVALVNRERTKAGLPSLVEDQTMRDVARGKSRDMFERRYFSHYDPDGKNASDWMEEAGITFTLVGENLAYAPDTTSAHEGLMNSEGHKANILESRFHRIGIGVMDGGIYGKMFTQIFAY